MKIFVYLDTEYRDSLWCTQCYRAICDEAAKKKYSVILLDVENVFEVDFDEFFNGEDKRLLMTLGTIPEKISTYFYMHNIHVLYVNQLMKANRTNCSGVMVDYVDSMRRLTDYLHGCGKKGIALYGINKKSNTDMIKANYFIGAESYNENGKYDIYFNKANLDECFKNLLPNIKNYDSFICANDIVAYSLINNLKKNGYRVPEDFYIASFGDSLLSQLGSPSLTAVTVDHKELGRQALFAYAYLRKSYHNVFITAKLPSTLQVRASTENKTPSPNPNVILHTTGTDHDENFYDDVESRRIFSIEHMLSVCDKLDMQIISGLLGNIPYSKMASGLFISENVIFYRIKRLIKASGTQNKECLTELLREFLSQKEISDYIAMDQSK